VETVTDDIRQLIKDMAASMYAAPGIGLAATQVNVHQRIIVIDVSETHDQLQVFINPEILSASGDADIEEGCLSVPGVYEKVRRAERVTVRALDAEGKPFTTRWITSRARYSSRSFRASSKAASSPG
jgi:peptide deformylase